MKKFDGCAKNSKFDRIVKFLMKVAVEQGSPNLQ